MVSVFSAAGILRREEKGVFSFGKVRTDDGAAGGVVGVVAGTSGSVIAGDCPSGCFFACVCIFSAIELDCNLSTLSVDDQPFLARFVLLSQQIFL